MSKDEIMDEELTGMVNYTDETVPTQMPVIEREDPPRKTVEKTAAVHDAKYEIVPQKHRSQIDKLYDMMKWLGICGGICYLMWWFEINGLMAMEASYPCILASAIIGASGTTWSAMRR